MDKVVVNFGLMNALRKVAGESKNEFHLPTDITHLVNILCPAKSMDEYILTDLEQDLQDDSDSSLFDSDSSDEDDYSTLSSDNDGEDSRPASPQPPMYESEEDRYISRLSPHNATAAALPLSDTDETMLSAAEEDFNPEAPSWNVHTAVRDADRVPPPSPTEMIDVERECDEREFFALLAKADKYRRENRYSDYVNLKPSIYRLHRQVWPDQDPPHIEDLMSLQRIPRINIKRLTHPERRMVCPKCFRRFADLSKHTCTKEMCPGCGLFFQRLDYHRTCRRNIAEKIKCRGCQGFFNDIAQHWARTLCGPF